MKYEFELDKLVNMIAHKCDYCLFSPAQCSEKNGCEKGVKAFLLKSLAGEKSEE